MTTTMNSKRDHVVDEHTEIVYLVATNWSSAISAPHWTNKYYPGYKTELVTQDRLNQKKEELK